MFNTTVWMTLFVCADGNTTLRKLSLNQLILPEANMTNYYRYEGSLTTPGCTEAVVWTVFEHPIPLDREQVRLKLPSRRYTAHELAF